MLTNSFIAGAASISFILALYADHYRKSDLEATLSDVEGDLGLPRITVFDFIIVGGGTAGCILASRLCLNPNISVLLLEEGGPPPPHSSNPYFYSAVKDHKDFNNYYSSLPQAGISGEDGGLSNITTGRMLGGSGSHNNNYYNRGSPHDYNNFAKILQDESWRYENILQYYKRIENFTGAFYDANVKRNEYFGNTGPLFVETHEPPLLQEWFMAGKELSYEIADPNARQRESFTPMVKSTSNGRRSSTYTSYLKPILDSGSRNNLKVLTYSEVGQVLLDEDKRAKRAYGVSYKRHGIPQIAHARKNVILSTSTFVTPIILMKSGIGPEKVLKDAGIPVIQDLPGVGQNLREHVGLFLEFTATNSSDEIFPIVQESLLEQELEKFHSTPSSGFYSRTKLGHAQAFFVSQIAKLRGEFDWPDIQIVIKQRERIIPNSKAKEKMPQKVFMHVSANRLQSKGEVHFDTKKYLNGERNAVKLAKIDYNLLNNENDTQILLEGINIALKIMEETKVMQNMGMKLTQDVPKSCQKIIPTRSPQFWKCYIRQRGKAWMHAVGTCQMGRSAQLGAVVDSKFRVFGVKNLRVVDASVFPLTPNANPNAPTMVIAQKAANDILDEYSIS